MIRPSIAVGEHKLIRRRFDGILTAGRAGEGISNRAAKVFYAPDPPASSERCKFRRDGRMRIN
jgi:hypothetical protein